MTAGFNLILLAQALAALLFLLALWPFATMDSRRRRHAALAGTIILSAAAIYDKSSARCWSVAALVCCWGGDGHAAD